MLSTALPPVPRNGADSIGEAAEVFNLSALGAYPTVAVTSRCLQSFQRSYGFANVTVIPKSESGTPGFCVAYYPDQSPPTAVISIAGIQGLSDLSAFITNRFAAAIPGLDYLVVQQFLVWAQAVAAALSANADWNNFRTNRRLRLRIGGFSAGASIAEILAAILKNANPIWDICVFKYASPRTGGNLFMDWVERNLTKAVWYVCGDPIRFFPAAVVRPSGPGLAMPIPGVNQWQDMFMDRFCQTLTPDGELNQAMPPFNALDGLRVLAQLRNYSNFTTDPYNPPNLWWLHARTTYRWCFQQMLRRESSLDWTRMLGLEYPGENQWNARWNDFQTVDPAMLTIVDPPPADEEVPLEFLNRAIDADTSGTTEGGDWGRDRDDLVVGGDWGDQTPMEERTIRVRLRRR